MGLHHITEDSTTIHYHCAKSTCIYHNCAAWEPWQQCQAHDIQRFVTIPASEMRERMQGALPQDQLDALGDTLWIERIQQRVEGKKRQLPIGHPEITWTGPGIVALPVYECGTQMFLKVDFTEQELNAPNITIAERDPSNPNRVTNVSQHLMVARHQQLAAKLREIGNVYTPPEAA